MAVDKYPVSTLLRLLCSNMEMSQRATNNQRGGISVALEKLH